MGDQAEVSDDTNSGTALETVEGFSRKAPTRKYEVTGRGEIFRKLTQNIPLNQYFLPDHLYRADLIPLDIFDMDPRDRAEILEAAALPVTFEHGYPSIGTLSPMWERLPAENSEAYDAYCKYLELPEATQSENPIRILTIISALADQAIEVIEEWCYTFFWAARARAYDLFLQVAHRKQREQRVMSIEGKHFKMAERFLSLVSDLAERKLTKELTDLTNDPDAETETKVKDLIDMAVKMAQVQRISLGLPSMGPEKVEMQHNLRNATPSESFRHIAKEGAGEEAPRQRSAEMDALLSNHDDLSTVQTLLIRMTNPQYKGPSWKDGDDVIDITPEPHPQSNKSAHSMDSQSGGPGGG